LSADGRLAPAARDIGDALAFFTRLPLRRGDGAPLDMNRIAWAAPVAGAIVGVVGAGVLAATEVLGLPRLISAGLATAALIAVTGALHEDGLADTADGFGGGATRERKLEIMRDSRIGAFGAVALALSILIRVAALAAALKGGFWNAAGSLILVAALARACRSRLSTRRASTAPGRRRGGSTRPPSPHLASPPSSSSSLPGFWRPASGGRLQQRPRARSARLR
jgi:adenosylcobinamide-GDP ribazoletransferase